MAGASPTAGNTPAAPVQPATPPPTVAQQTAQQTATALQQPAAMNPSPTGPDNTIWTVVIAFLGILFHIWDGIRTNGFSQFGARFAMYSSLFIVAWWLKAFRPHGTTWENMWESLKLNLIALFYPMLLLFILGSTNFITSLWGGGNIVDPNLIAILIWFFPPYFFYFVLIREWNSPWPGRFRSFYVWMWILIGFFLFWGTLNSLIVTGGISEVPFLYDEGQGTDIGSAWDKFISLIGNALENFWTLITDTISGILFGTTRLGQEALYTATGGALFAGAVERNAEVELGVVFRDLENVEPKSYITDPLRVFGILAISPIQDDSADIDPLTINSVKCFWGDRQNATIGEGELIPPRLQNKQDYSVQEEVDVDCFFNATAVSEDIGPGPKVVTFQTEYDFKTLGYIKGYTIERDLSRALRRERVDPFDQYGITDKNPQAIHTNGPMMIGMDLPSLPIEIENAALGDPAAPAPNRFTLGISFSNRWPGKVKSFKSLTLGLPAGMEIVADDCAGVRFNRSDEENGNVAWVAVGSDNDASEEDKRVLNEPFDNLFAGLIPHKTIRCDLSVGNEEDIETVLGTSPIETKHFSVDLEYTYESQESLPVNILLPAGVNVPQTEISLDSGSGIWLDFWYSELKCDETVPADLQELNLPKFNIKFDGAGPNGQYRWRVSYQGWENEAQTIPGSVKQSDWQIHNEQTLIFPPDTGDIPEEIKGDIKHGEYILEAQAVDAGGISGNIESCKISFTDASPADVTRIIKTIASAFEKFLVGQGKEVADSLEIGFPLLVQFAEQEGYPAQISDPRYASAIIRETFLINKPQETARAFAGQIIIVDIDLLVSNTNLPEEEYRTLVEGAIDDFIDSDLAADPSINNKVVNIKQEIADEIIDILYNEEESPEESLE